METFSTAGMHMDACKDGLPRMRNRMHICIVRHRTGLSKASESL
jgi:hypothetical protein